MKIGGSLYKINEMSYKESVVPFCISMILQHAVHYIIFSIKVALCEIIKQIQVWETAPPTLVWLSKLSSSSSLIDSGFHELSKGGSPASLKAIGWNTFAAT